MENRLSAAQAHKQGVCAKDCYYCDDVRFSGQTAGRVVQAMTGNPTSRRKSNSRGSGRWWQAKR